jgi:glycosyltransferase involved in cell wall biosynthesis
VVTRTGGPVYERNFAISPCLSDSRVRQVLVQQGFQSASLAYNDAIQKATGDVLIFCHQDMYFPEDWLNDLQKSIDILNQKDPHWAVLGCWGVTVDGQGVGYILSYGHGTLGAPFDTPRRVNTLDECVLILRKSSGLTFDPYLPDFHFYGTDICLSARKSGLTCYVISAFAIHNTRTLKILPSQYFDGYFHVKKTWSEYLPIYTACANVTKLDRDFYVQQLKKVRNYILRRDTSPAPRLDDPRQAISLKSQDVGR